MLGSAARVSWIVSWTARVTAATMEHDQGRGAPWPPATSWLSSLCRAVSSQTRTGQGRGAPWPPARPGSAAARPSRHPRQPCRPRRLQRPCARRPRPPAQGPLLPRPGRLRPRPWPPCVFHSRCGRLLTGSTALLAELMRGLCTPSASCKRDADVLQLAFRVKLGSSLYTRSSESG